MTRPERRRDGDAPVWLGRLFVTLASSLGASIWAERHRPHHDRRLPMRDIWFYRYDNDVPVSTDNMP